MEPSAGDSRDGVVDAPEHIRNLVDWDDTTIYHWTLHDTTPHVYELIGSFLVNLVLTVLVYAGFWLVGIVFPTVALWVAIGSGGFLVIALAWSICVREPSRGTHYVVIIVFGCLAYAMSSPESFIAHGFSGAVGSWWQWSLFFFDTTLRAVTLDATEEVGVSISSLAPESTAARLATVVLKLLITAGFVEMAVALYRLYRGSEFFGTVQEGYWRCAEHMDIEGLVLTRWGQVVNLDESVRLDGFVFVSTFEAEADQRSE